MEEKRGAECSERLAMEIYDQVKKQERARNEVVGIFV